MNRQNKDTNDKDDDDEEEEEARLRRTVGEAETKLKIELRRKKNNSSHHHHDEKAKEAGLVPRTVREAETKLKVGLRRKTAGGGGQQQHTSSCHTRNTGAESTSRTPPGLSKASIFHGLRGRSHHSHHDNEKKKNNRASSISNKRIVGTSGVMTTLRGLAKNQGAARSEEALPIEEVSVPGVLTTAAASAAAGPVIADESTSVDVSITSFHQGDYYTEFDDPEANDRPADISMIEEDAAAVSNPPRSSSSSTSELNEATNPPTSLPSTPAQHPPPRPVLQRTNAGLAVAHLVDDDTLLLMEEAQEVDPEHLHQRQEEVNQEKRRQYYMIGLAIAITLCWSVLVVVLGITFGRNKKDDEAFTAPTAGAPSMKAEPSDSPSLAPTTFLDLFFDDLPAYTLESLKNGSTPQWKALTWLENHPDLLDMEEWRKKQLFALVTFFFALGGPNWPEKIRDDWLLYDKSECYWFSSEYGLFGEDGTYLETPTNNDPCNQEGQFQLIGFRDLNLWEYSNPYIPPEVALLTSLSLIAMPLNGIAGSLINFLPSQLYQMTSLQELNLFGNSLMGPLPSELGLMTNLTSLSLTKNSLTGSIPTQLGLLSKLQLLNLATNPLTGSIPTELGLMTDMVNLRLARNGWTGTIPSEVGMMSHLKRLHLRYNSLTGPIPSEFGRMTDMVEMSPAANMLSGSIPTQLGLMTGTTLLYLYGNHLAGRIPKELSQMTQMTHLGLYGNNLEGTIPTELGLLTNMELLSLADNSLSGQLPSQLGAMTSMTALYVMLNNLSGSIPSEFGLITSLEKLRLENNNLTGSIPQQLDHLASSVNGSMLLLLSLTDNMLSGAVPESLCSLGMVDVDIGVGLYYDCNDKQLCGCCWCPCTLPGNNVTSSSSSSSSSSITADEDDCQTQPFDPSKDDEEWPGMFPTPVNRSNAITINIHPDRYPEDLTLEWSVLLAAPSDGSNWEVLNLHQPQHASSLNTYNKEVESDAIYRLKLYDSYGDGVCCGQGFGWFTITNSIQSSTQDHGKNNNEEGTVIWDAAGYVLKNSLDVFVWVSSEGDTHHVEYVPNQGYAMIQGDQPVFVMLDVNSTGVMDVSSPVP